MTGEASTPGRDPRTVLVSFATAQYYEALHHLVQSARPFVDGYLCFREVDLPPRFLKRNARHFADGVGFGYWVWKPFVILEALERVSWGDIVIYVDAANLVVGDLAPLFSRCAASEHGLLLFENREGHPDGDVWRNSTWTTNECFAALGTTGPEFVHGPHANGAYVAVQKRPETVEFMRRYLAACENYDAMRHQPRRATDATRIDSLRRDVASPSKRGDVPRGRGSSSCTGPRDAPDQQPDFVEHRWDQSVLSLLAIVDGVPLQTPPCQHRGPTTPESSTPSPPVFDHHRSRFRLEEGTPGFVALRRTARWRARLRRIVGRRNRLVWLDGQAAGLERLPRPTIDASIIAANRRTLARVDRWLTDEVWEHAVSSYGMADWVRAAIDLPIDESPTYTDLLCALAAGLDAPCFLEIGVSVGKNLVQVWNQVEQATLVGIDREAINPRLTGWLTAGDRATWPTPPESMKPTESSITEYRIDGRPTNTLWYLSGDEFDPQLWGELTRWRFNLVLSDALHEPAAVHMEFDELTQRGLLDRDRGAIVWDDLQIPGLLAVVSEFRAPLEDYLGRPPSTFGITEVAGWLGQHETKHTVGVATWGDDPGRWSAIFTP